MSGRHLKQSESGNVAGKAALSGLALTGAGMWFSSTAEAATDDQWDRVAACESSNNWHINTGNGYQGGLQFSSSTWIGHGGAQFAPAANLATREQQIVIAERVLANQGRGAWPVCGTGLGAATLRDSAPAPRAPESLQPNESKPNIVAVADVEKDAVSDNIAPAVVKTATRQAVPVTQAGFATIAESLQIGQANDLRAPAPMADPDDSAPADEDAPEAEAPAADAEAPEAEDEAAPEAVEASLDTDSLGAFMLAAQDKGLAVSV